MSSEAVISVNGVSKAYPVFERPHDRLLQMLVRGRRRYYTEFSALQDVSFSVAQGETVGIVGKNGSGKSTLLQIICGTLEQSAGEVSVRGRVAALLELGAGFNPEFTGRENITLYAMILGLTAEELEERFDLIVAFADIGEFLDQPVKTYSSGMVVRLAFAVIAHVDADILVIDEALAVGDAYFVQKCMRFLRAFKERGTLLFVSHDTASVLALCDRAVWLERGQVRAVDVAKTVVNQYLEGLYGEDAAPVEVGSSRAAPEDERPVRESRDQRADFINHSNLRNDIELHEFEVGAAGFADGQAHITNVEFLEGDRKLSWVVGGESVGLRIDCATDIALDRPIVGFLVKNRLGQPVFGDNTHLTYHDDPVPMPAGSTGVASFTFTMPVLPVGAYTIDVSISNGVQQDHQMLSWRYDVLAFDVHASSVVHGLIGVPMTRIELRVEER
jgi:lipopolysaccharide transport system ATP-binding protein